MQACHVESALSSLLSQTCTNLLSFMKDQRSEQTVQPAGVLAICKMTHLCDAQPSSNTQVVTNIAALWYDRHACTCSVTSTVQMLYPVAMLCLIACICQ